MTRQGEKPFSPLVCAFVADIALMTGKHARANRNTSQPGAVIATSILLSIDVGASLPDYIHLLTAGPLRMNRVDNIKPLKPGQVPKLCSYDGLDTVDRAPIDVNHAYAKRGVLGEETPAFGWLIALEARDDGLWGKVDWNDRGRAAIVGREYRSISAELMTIDGEIIGVRGASLTNHPNLKGLTPVLNSAEEDDFMDKILKDLLAKLGLKEDATPDAVLQSVTTLVEGNAGLTAQLAAIGKAAGAAADAKPEAILQSVTALASTGGDAEINAGAIVGLKAELQSVTAKFNTLNGDIAKDKATAFVDGAIAQGRVGVKPLRDHYIKRHMLSAADVETEINAMPKLAGSTIIPADMPKDGAVLLSAAEAEVCKALGLTPEAFKKTQAAQLAAVNG